MSGPKPPSGFPQQLSFAQMPGGEDFVKANKPTADHRYPRGFTPQRLHEVAEAMPDERFAIDQWHRSPTRPTSASRGGLRPPNTYWTTSDTEGEDEARQVFRHRAIDVVARSTVPTKDVRNVNFIIGNTSPSLGLYRDTREQDRHGAWVPSGQVTLSATAGAESGAQAEATLVHEIGHHADRTENVIRWSDRRASGRNPDPVLEGAAEGYMSLHHVARPGSPPAYRVYDEKFAPPGAGNMEYLQARKDASQGTVDYAERSYNDRKPPSDIVSPPMSDPKLWQRDVSTLHTQTERDFGQWPLLDSEGKEPVGTIRSGVGVPPLEQRLRSHVDPKRYQEVMALKERRLNLRRDNPSDSLRGGARVPTDDEMLKMIGGKTESQAMHGGRTIAVGRKPDPNAHWR